MNQLTNTSRDLFPVQPDTEATRLIWRLQTRERDERGKMVLRAPISTIDRQTIAKRRDALVPAVAPAPPVKIKAAVAQMLTGFGSSRESDDSAAAASVAQYVHILMGLPIHAIERACRRFAAGEVTADEVGAKRIERAFAPSTAQLRMVAERVARPYYDEHRCAEMLLKGVTERVPLTPEERERAGARIRSMHGEVTAALAKSNLDDARRQDEQHVDISKTVRDANDKIILKAYQDKGLAPVYADTERTTLVSLEMMVARGWRIEEDQNGKNVLVAPAKKAAGGER